ncbi:MAG: response regulator [Desulfobacteraceae bacterium]|nr:MAG: response regulator [Desulfobacteraceae bacterium]
MNEKLLIVEDESDIREMLSSILKQEGFRVRAAPGGYEAIEIFKSEPFDAVITDMRMPGIDGLTVMRRLKEIDEDVEVIILTAFAALDNVIEAFRNKGAFDYLTKPLGDINELLIAVSQALESRRLKEENKILIRQLRDSKLDLENRVEARTIELTQANRRLESELLSRKKIESALKQAHDNLEMRVKERTAELLAANEQLQIEIEERRRVEDQILKGKKLLQSVFDGISDPLMMLDASVTVRMLNRAAAEYFGADSQDAVGRRCFTALCGQPAPCDSCPIPKAIKKGAAASYERKGLIAPNRLEQVVIYPLHEESVKGRSAIIRISDITDAKLMERQLMQNEKLVSLGLLVSGISHEINNPNNFISFNIPILRDYLGGMIPILEDHAKRHPDFEIFGMPYDEFRQDLFKLIENIEHGSSRINATVSRLREFSRRRDHSQKQQIDLASVIEKGIALCRSQIEKVTHSFEVKIPDRLPPVYADPEVIEQVTVNLLINAAQALDKAASWIRLEVTVEGRRQDRIIIEVGDNGCGMDESIIEKIFDPFFSTKGTGEGNTGLGLYICQTRLEAIGGRIEVKSRPGIGSTFRVYLSVSR